MTTKLVNLKDGNDILVPKVFEGIDTSNVLETWTHTNANQTHTIQNDGILVAYTTDVSANICIDDVIVSASAKSNYFVRVWFPVKIGQVQKSIYGGGTVSTYTIYGTKYI